MTTTDAALARSATAVARSAAVTTSMVVESGGCECGGRLGIEVRGDDRDVGTARGGGESERDTLLAAGPVGDVADGVDGLVCATRGDENAVPAEVTRLRDGAATTRSGSKHGGDDDGSARSFAPVRHPLR